MDDSHACLKKDYIQEFHGHLNSVNPNIQITKELEKDNGLSVLDTTTTRVRGRLQVCVYRKPTHTDKYLDYNSHHPSQHQRSVVNNLLRRAQEIPSTNAGRSRERTHVIKVLRDNNYPLRFIRSCKSYHSALHRDSNTNDASSASAPSTSTIVVLPYVRGATMVLKWVTNAAMFCARVSRDQRTNLLLCSAEVLFTRSAALIATSCVMDRLTEPWKQG